MFVNSHNNTMLECRKRRPYGLCVWERQWFKWFVCAHSCTIVFFLLLSKWLCMRWCERIQLVWLLKGCTQLNGYSYCLTAEVHFFLNHMHNQFEIHWISPNFMPVQSNCMAVDHINMWQNMYKITNSFDRSIRKYDKHEFKWSIWLGRGLITFGWALEMCEKPTLWFSFIDHPAHLLFQWLLW